MSPTEDEQELLAWLQEDRSLSELSERFPEAWAAIKQERTSQVQLNPVNSYLIQQLFFTRQGERKPVSMSWFHLIWPLIWQKKSLMQAVEFQGIYCFYTKKLIQELSNMIGSQSCLEIAAGDGTLTRFLKAQGVQIIATDNQSWKFSINYPDMVINRGAKEALQTYNPEVVICSWPPKNNDFERYIFQTASVQTYILISSHTEAASGNWMDYREQTAFSFEELKGLSKLLIPPELGPAVYIFRRFGSKSVQV